MRKSFIKKAKMKTLLFFLTLSLTILIALSQSDEKQTRPDSFHQFLNRVQEWRGHMKQSQEPKLSAPLVVAGVLCFIASSISSAGGIGGGGLFIPIMTIVAGLDLKTASSFSAFMVTGGSVANVVYNLSGKALIDYDLALLLEPCMLLGVSIGVICNRVFPEWIITALFAVFLAWSTLKTFKNGIMFWKLESEMVSRKERAEPEKAFAVDRICEESEAVKSAKEPLLGVKPKIKNGRFPRMKLGVLVIIWFAFFIIYLLRGNKYGQGIISIKPCGTEYWILLSLQIPLSVFFTKWILCREESLQHQPQDLLDKDDLSAAIKTTKKLMFPIMALFAGLLGGLFGIGGGMLISPLLLQVGIAPEITAATTSFMVFFSAIMSAIQYLLLGMDHIEAALIFSVVCLIASLVGLVLIQRAINQCGRASLVVFSVGLVMALSAVLMTSFGALDVWRDYVTGKYMGFRLPC